MNKAVFIDRDGVINLALESNGKPLAPKNLSQLQILPGVAEAIATLKKNSFIPVVVTNQPDVAKKLTPASKVTAINSKISELTGLDHFYVCFHDDLDQCDCRKPKVGLFKHAIEELSIQIKDSFMVGDRWRDIEAGQALGCKCFFIDYGYSEKKPTAPFIKVNSLLEAVGIICNISNGRQKVVN